MSEKFAVKRLSKADLTFFEWHYRNPELWEGARTNQKAINLDHIPFVDPMYPGAPDFVEQVAADPAGKGDRSYSVEIAIYGPGDRSLNNGTRSISWSDKNWRLNGLVGNPESDPERYDELRAGDLAVFAFDGEPAPDRAAIVFLRHGDPHDDALHSSLNGLLTPTRSMVQLSREELAHAIADAGGAVGHGIHDLLDGAHAGVATDVAETGAPTPDPGTHVTKTGVYLGREAARDDLTGVKAQNDADGQLGEAFVNDELARRKADGLIQEFDWVSERIPASPWDFVKRSPSGEEERLDVKATRGKFSNVIYLSLNEIKGILASESYEIWRVYEMDDATGTAKLRISTDVRAFAEEIFDALAALPAGIGVGSFSFNPALLLFGDEQLITRET